jgi:hypothetical protein
VKRLRAEIRNLKKQGWPSEKNRLQFWKWFTGCRPGDFIAHRWRKRLTRKDVRFADLPMIEGAIGKFLLACTKAAPAAAHLPPDAISCIGAFQPPVVGSRGKIVLAGG